MRNLQKTIFAGAFGVCLVAGCGYFKRETAGAVDQRVNFELMGKWGSNCVKTTWLGLTKTDETMEFSGVGGFEKTTYVHAGNECEKPSVVVTSKGTARTAGNVEGVEGAKELNLTIDEYALTPKTDAITNALNLASYCGVKNWQINVMTDVTDKDCVGKTFKKGTVVFDIYKAEGNTLHFGKSSSFALDSKEKADKRPTALDNEKVFSKK